MKDAPSVVPLDNPTTTQGIGASPLNFAGVIQPSDSLLPIPGSVVPDANNDGLPPFDLVDFSHRAGSLLNRVTSPGNQNFTSADLARLTEDPSIKGQDAVVLATLYEMAVPNGTGIVGDPVKTPLTSRGALQALANPSQLTDTDQAAGFNRVAIPRVDDALGQRLAAPHSDALYADATNPLNSIKANDIHQGNAGDCYFEGTLATVAAQSPQLIRDAITANHDGTFTVKFKGDPDHPVTVQRPTDAELALYNGASPDGIWAAVMEKGFSRYMTDVQHRPMNGLTRTDASASGDPYDVLQLLTGHDPDQLQFGTNRRADGPTQADEVNRIAQTFKAGHSAVLSTFANADVADLTDNHSYSILGYQPGPDGGTLKLRNPDQDDATGQPSSITVGALERLNAVVTVETANKPEKPPFVM